MRDRALSKIPSILFFCDNYEKHELCFMNFLLLSICVYLNTHCPSVKTHSLSLLTVSVFGDNSVYLNVQQRLNRQFKSFRSESVLMRPEAPTQLLLTDLWMLKESRKRLTWYHLVLNLPLSDRLSQDQSTDPGFDPLGCRCCLREDDGSYNSRLV